MEGNSKKTSYGECRCCLMKGNHRNILKEYFNDGVREVYIEIFMDCFNLFLTTDTSVSSLICVSCIERLRDASAFRSLVVETERHLLDAVKHGQDTVFVNVSIEEPPNSVKPEPLASVKVEVCDSDVDDFIDDFITADNIIDSESKPECEFLEAEAALLSRFRRDQLQLLPTRDSLYSICPGYVAHLDLLRHVKVTSNSVKLNSIESKRILKGKNTFVSEKVALITNVKTLLQFSNLTPFKSRSRSGYPCFYCRNIFEDFNILREHVLEHKTIEIVRVLKRSGPESLVVYAEVTNLKCNICDANIPNINELKSHLVKVHSKKMYPDVSDRVIPFKINDGISECQICGCIFETFGAIERHMNGHYRNYVCRECGSGFITKYRLKVHSKSMHVEGTYPCELCGKIFSTQQKHKNHVNAVHKMIKRFKCAKCPQRFSEYFRRHRHMEEEHGVAPLKYKCNVCDRSFDRRYTLSRHLKRDHLEERDYQCEICAYKCFTKNELKVHMVKHNGARIFECSVCKKSYARKKTLKEHMRIHNNDRRFACGVCGQAFVQKCSLKGHLKTHHLEYHMQHDL